MGNGSRQDIQQQSFGLLLFELHGISLASDLVRPFQNDLFELTIPFRQGENTPSNDEPNDSGSSNGVKHVGPPGAIPGCQHRKGKAVLLTDTAVKVTSANLEQVVADSEI